MKFKIVSEGATILQLLCKQQRKCGMLLSPSSVPKREDGDHDLDELVKAVPFLAELFTSVLMELAFHGPVYLFFESHEEMMEAYDLVVGDDGPTAKNPYNGEARVYALTCSKTGKLETENT